MPKKWCWMLLVFADRDPGGRGGSSDARSTAICPKRFPRTVPGRIRTKPAKSLIAPVPPA
jgi:hypothetical protein